jgi:hypothetical protein
MASEDSALVSFVHPLPIGMAFEQLKLSPLDCAHVNIGTSCTANIFTLCTERTKLFEKSNLYAASLFSAFQIYIELQCKTYGVSKIFLAKNVRWV